MHTNPLSRVIELLDSLAAKVTMDGEAEAKAYGEFVTFCDNVARTTRFQIKTAEAKQAKLKASIGKATGDVEASVAKIEDLAASITTGNDDLRSATQIRDKEAAEFATKEAELRDVVDTIGRAIAVMQREMAKNPASFAQVSAASSTGSLVKSLEAVVDAASFSNADKQKLVSMVQAQQGEGSEDDDFGAPAAAAYKTHSNSILDVLEDLKEKAEEQLSGLRKAETNARHNYAMLKQSLDDQIAADDKDLEEEKSSKAASLESKATDAGDLSGTVKDLDDGKSALASSSSNCMQTAADHEATVKSRQEELKALAQAKSILTQSTSGASQQTYSLLQSAANSQVQTRADLARVEVVTLVKRLAREHHSAALAQLASRIQAVLRFGSAAGEDPFAKVRGLVSELISKLEAEAQSETNEKAYCDEQLAKTEAKKGELEDVSSKLAAKIDKAAAKSTSIKAAVKELEEELVALAKEQATMDQIRREQSSNFAKAKSDLEAGLQGVRKAIGVLREYYGSEAAAASMIQDAPSRPEQHVKAEGAGSSIIGILEVVESDFAKNLASASSEEDDSEAEYDKTTQENKVSKTLKDQDVKYNTKEYQTLDKNIADLSADRETNSAELNAVLEYYDHIKARCIAKPETYESRRARREAEIRGLKEALSILSDEVALVQHGKKASRGSFLGLH